jgi:outer membrane protein assembly factor BamB
VTPYDAPVHRIRRLTAVATVVAAVVAAALTLLASGALAASATHGVAERANAGRGGEQPLPEQGVLYESAPDDAQRVEFWVIGAGDDDELLLSMSVDVRCVEGKKLFGVGDFIGTVDEDGEISASGIAFSSEPEDGPATSGLVELEGRMTADGGAEGTVSVEFVQTNEQDEDDVYARCEVDDEAWQLPSGTPDADLERVQGIVPLEGDLSDPYSLAPVVADATDLYAVYQDGDDGVLRQVSIEDGDEGWSEDLDGLPKDLAMGDGVVWVGGLGSFKKPKVAGFDTKDGSEVARLAGEEVAVGPDGSVWVTSLRERAVRRIDPATGDVVTEVPLAGESFGSLAVGPEGLYLDLRPDATGDEFVDVAFHRLDPQTGAVLATADHSLTGAPVYPDADGVGLWINEPRSAYRADARTLAELADTGVHALSEAPAGGSRLWVGAFDGLLGLDPSGEIGFEIPGLYGKVGSNGTTVFLITEGLGMLRIDGS